MRRGVASAKTILLAAALQGGAAPLDAQRVTLKQLFPAQPAGYVTDQAHALDPASVRQIEATALRLKDATGAELAIVVLPTIGDYSAVDVAVEIGRAWGVGAKARVGDLRRNSGPFKVGLELSGNFVGC